MTQRPEPETASARPPAPAEAKKPGASAARTTTITATNVTPVGSAGSPVRQPVTPELRRWIIEQTQAGHGVSAVLQSMCKSGWAESVALAALESTLQQHVQQAGVQPPPGQAKPQALPAGAAARQPMPGPRLDGAPARIDCAGHGVDVLLTLAKPRVVLFANLLTADECQALIDAATPRMRRSLTVATKTGGEEVNADRTSDGMFFRRGETELLQRIEARIASLLHWPVEYGEGLQVLHYRPGAEYKPHYDYFDPNEPGTPSILKRGGQRVATLVLYLNTPEQGGATTFPDLQLEVTAQRGNAVFFAYERAHPDSRSLHGGAPVRAGEKWIATKWLREGEFK